MGRAGQPTATSRFIENLDIEWNATAPRGLEYWQILAHIINEEPVRAVDKAWMAMLLPLGIEKGVPFRPDERQQAILLKGVAMGELDGPQPSGEPPLCRGVLEEGWGGFP